MRRKTGKVDEPKRLHARSAHHVVVGVEIGPHPLDAQSALEVRLDVAPRGIPRFFDEGDDCGGVRCTATQLFRDPEVLPLPTTQVAHVAVAVVMRAIGVGELPEGLLALLLREGCGGFLLARERLEGVAREGGDLLDIEGFVVRDSLHEDVIANGESGCRGRDGDTFGDGIGGLSHTPRLASTRDAPVGENRKSGSTMTGDDAWAGCSDST